MDGDGVYTYLFSSLKKAQQFAVWFLNVNWDEDLEEYLADEELPAPKTDLEKLALYETVINEGSSGAFFTIEEAEVDPVGRAEIHPFAPRATLA
jgi:hypothetical protein